MLGLGWKTLKDYLEHEGRVLQTVVPRAIVKEAISARILRDGQVWVDMLDHRNLLSRTYDASTFNQAVIAIRDRYLAAIEELRSWFKERIA